MNPGAFGGAGLGGLPFGFLSGLAKVADEVVQNSVVRASLDAVALPQEFASLLVVVNVRSDNAVNEENALMSFNGDSGGNYPRQRWFVQGTSTTGDSSSSSTSVFLTNISGNSNTADYYGCALCLLPNYSSPRHFKSFWTMGGGYFVPSARGTLLTSVGSWISKEPISKISVFPGSSANWMEDSRLTVYGL